MEYNRKNDNEEKSIKGLLTSRNNSNKLPIFFFFWVHRVLL